MSLPLSLSCVLVWDALTRTWVTEAQNTSTYVNLTRLTAFKQNSNDLQGGEESRELVSHLKYQIQTSTERFLLLLRERSLGCNHEWHARFDDVSILHTVSHFPNVSMALKKWPSGNAVGPDLGFDMISRNSSVDWEVPARDSALTGLTSNFETSMNTPGSSTSSNGSQHTPGCLSHPQSTQFLIQFSDGLPEPHRGSSDGSSSSMSTLPNVETTSDYLFNSQPPQSYSNHYPPFYVPPEMTPSSKFSGPCHWNQPLQNTSIDFGQPAPGGLPFDYTSFLSAEEMLQTTLSPNAQTSTQEHSPPQDNKNPRYTTEQSAACQQQWPTILFDT